MEEVRVSAPHPFTAAVIRGLTQQEVSDRRARGEVNRYVSTTSRPIASILRSNFITLFNGILAVAVIMLVAVGQYRDAFFTGGLVLFSVAISIFQEIRAKFRLDQIAVLNRAPVRVIRDGMEYSIDPTELVLGDYLLLSRGDSVVADGKVVFTNQLEVDESLLTGESDPVPKGEDARVFSGSYCVAGTGVYVAELVGEESYAQRLSAAARQYRNPRTPTQELLDRVLRILLFFVILLTAVQAIDFGISREPFISSVRAIAVIATLVPQGLLLMSTVAYSVGAVRLAQAGALIQQLNAVESLSHVDVLCLDKTGTITANRLRLHQVFSLSGKTESVKELVAVFAASFPEPNATLRAISATLPSASQPVVEVIPFSSERRWSGLTFAPPCDFGTVVFGAPEALYYCCGDIHDVQVKAADLAATGLRVLLLAQSTEYNPGSAEPNRCPSLPAGLRVVALVTLEEVIRSDAEATLAAFAEQGVAVKIISGDNPQTVLAIARRVGLPESAQAISGAELAAMDISERAQTIENAMVFGRISPQEKQDILRQLRDNGHYVAMIGDGVNDVLALKQANVGVAMRSGSPAARSAADVVLLNDSFNVLPSTLDEGRRVINAMLLLIKLFLIRDVATIELIFATILFRAPFPFLPTHSAIISFLTVGFPSLLVVIWASTARPRPETLREIVVPVLVLGTTSALAITTVYFLSLPFFSGDVASARTAAVTAALLSGAVALVLFWYPLNAPFRTLFSDARVVALAVLVVVAFYVILFAGVVPHVGALPRFFELRNLSFFDLAIALPVVLLWFGFMRLLVRSPLAAKWLA